MLDELIIKRRGLIAELLDTNLDVRVLGDILELGKNSSVRKDRIASSKEAHADLAPLIDDLLSKYDDYDGVKGVLDDPSDLMRLLRGAGVLEFRILATPDGSNPDMIDSSNPEYNEPLSRYVTQLEEFGPRPRPNDKFQWFKIEERDEKDWPERLYIIR